MLARCELDTKERYKFFGLQRQRACGIGSGPRKGRSCLRQCTPHASRPDLTHKRLQAISCDEHRVGKECAESLKRIGFHPKIACTAILVDGKDITLRIPTRLFGGLYAYDLMHHLFINCIGYLVEAIMDVLTPAKQRCLDRLSALLGAFHDPATGEAARRVAHVTKLSYLTAEQKVTLLFTLTVCIAPAGKIIPEAIRPEVLTALAAMQTICYVTRGKRPFTEPEHNFVWEVIGKKFWRCLSAVVRWKEYSKAKDVRARNERLPPHKRKLPKEFQPRRPDTDESSDTVDTASDDTDEPQHFIRSDKIVPHSFVHFAEQVKLGGTHQFHNTSAAESKHQGCIQLAGKRVRKYNELHITEASMLDYTLDIALFDEIALMVEELGASLSKHYFKTLHRNTIYNVSLKIYSENTTSEHDL